MAGRNHQACCQCTGSIPRGGPTADQELVSGGGGELENLVLPQSKDGHSSGRWLPHTHDNDVTSTRNVTGSDSGHPSAIESGPEAQCQECSSGPLASLSRLSKCVDAEPLHFGRRVGR